MEERTQEDRPTEIQLISILEQLKTMVRSLDWKTRQNTIRVPNPTPRILRLNLVAVSTRSDQEDVVIQRFSPTAVNLEGKNEYVLTWIRAKRSLTFATDGMERLTGIKPSKVVTDEEYEYFEPLFSTALEKALAKRGSKTTATVVQQTPRSLPMAAKNNS